MCVKQAECPLVSCSKTLWQDERIVIDIFLLFWAPSWKSEPHRLTHPSSAVSVLRSPELVCQSAQPAWPRIEVSVISRPPHRTNIWGSYLPGTDVPPRPSGDPVQERIRSVYIQHNETALFRKDHHRVADHSRAWWFVLHFIANLKLRMIDRVARNSTFLVFFIFSPLVFCHLFAGVMQV